MSAINFTKIKEMYRDSFDKHGDSTHALLTPKGRQEERFGTVIEYLKAGDRVLDFGCGLGYFYDYLTRKGISDINYHGVDMSEEFINTCNKNFKSDNCRFDLVEPKSQLQETYDVVFCSGVFNINYSTDPDTHRIYVYQKLKNLFNISQRVLICDFLSPNVDFRQTDSYHVDLPSLMEFCQKNLSRRWQLRHDILPYEVTLIAYADDHINRSDNTYSSDCLG